MSPRIAGVLLLSASVAAGVFAGWGIASPPWSIPGALLLTAATIGMLAGLLWLFRSSWADKSWPPGPKDMPTDERARRSMLRLGVFMLVPLPALVALLAWTLVSQEGDPSYLLTPALYTLLLSVGGVFLVRTGMKDPTSEPVDEDTDPTGGFASPAGDDGWLPLGRPDWRTEFVLTARVFPYVMLLIPLQASRLFSDAPVVGFLVTVGILFAAVVITILVARARNPRVDVNPTRQLLRTPRRTAAWAELTSAQLTGGESTPGAGRTLVLTLHNDDGLRAPLVLRRGGRLGLTASERTIAAQIVAASRIALPIAREDPSGRFAHINFPNNVTKDEALDVVQRPPGRSDPLPIGKPR